MSEVQDRVDELEAANDDLRTQVLALEEERDNLQRDNEQLTEKVDDATKLANDIVQELTRR